MRKFLVFYFIVQVVACLMIPSPARADTTYVSGIISTNTTWTPAGSPYIVVGNMLVDSSVTLDIQPGVEVKINSSKYIMIKGILNAIGTETDSIIITKNGTASWSRLWFKPASAGSLKYCRIEYAGNSAIYDSATSSLYVGYNTISNDSGYNGGGIYSWNSSPTIINNTISNNFASNTGGGISNNYSSSTITNNTISGNSSDWGGGGIWNQGPLSVIENNVISDNSATTLGGGIFSYGSPTINNNTISNNSAEHGGGICGYDSLMIINNSIFNNSATYGGGISSRGPLMVKYNNIIDTTSFAIYIKEDSCFIRTNNINASGYAVYNNSSSDVDARYNYWYTTDTNTIDAKIYDYYDDFNLGKVNYIPFLTSESNITITLDYPNGGESYQGGSTHNITWTTSGSGIDHIRLLYSTNSGSTYPDTIVYSTPDDGSYAWTVPNINSSMVKVKAQALDASNTVLAEDEGDGDFTIYPAFYLSVNIEDLASYNELAPTDTLWLPIAITNHSSRTVYDIGVKAYINGQETPLDFLSHDLNGDGKIDSLKVEEQIHISCKSYIPQVWENKNVLVNIYEIEEHPVDFSGSKQISVYYNIGAYGRPFEICIDGYSFPNSPFDWNSWRDWLATISSHPMGWIPLFSEITQWGGRCFGMASTSLLYFKYPELKPVAEITFKMNENDPGVMEKIIAYYNSQFFYWELWKDKFVGNDPNQVEETTKNLLKNNKLLLVIVNNESGTGRHCIAGYKMICELSQDKSHLYLYDNNFHSKTFHGTFNLSDHSFLYVDADNPPFHYTKICIVEPYPLILTGDFLEVKFCQYLREKTKALWDAGLMQFSHACPVKMLIADEYGRRIGFVDGSTFVNEIPGADVSFLDGGNGDTLAYYDVPKDLNYTVYYFGSDNSNMDAEILKPYSEESALTLSYINVPVTPSMIGTLTVNAQEDYNLYLDQDGNGVVDTVVAPTVDNLPPSSFELLYPIDEDTISTVHPTLVWSSAFDLNGDTVKYNLIYSPDSTFTVDVDTIPGLIDTSYTVSTPLSNGTYTWFVEAYDKAAGVTSSNETWHFVVYKDTIPPSVPVLVSPANGANIADTLLTFIWHSSIDGWSGMDYYILEYANNPSFTNADSVNTADTSYTPSFGFPDTTYYWKVRAVDKASNQSNWSSVWNFEIDTQSPIAPALISPPDSSWLNYTGVLFEWGEVLKSSSSSGTLVPPSVGRNINVLRPAINEVNVLRGQNPKSGGSKASPIHYILQLDTTTKFNTPIIDTTNVTYDTLTLDEYFYYWRVRAYDEAGNEGDFSQAFCFVVDTTSPSIDSTTQLGDTVGYFGPFHVDSKIIDNFYVKTATLFYRVNGSGWEEDTMGCWDVWYRGVIPEQTPADTLIIDYYITASDYADNVSRDPEEGNYSFKIFLTGIQETRDIPDRFVLFSPKPNPSVGIIEIQYGLPKKANVSLQIYDIQGRLVKSIFSGSKDAGYYKLWMDSKDLSSGIYFIRLETPKSTQIKKLIILQ